MERIWGPELAWAWVDASEGRFAEALVGVLREVAEVAEVAMRAGRGGVVDVVCVVREVIDGRKGYGLLMDVRTIGEENMNRREQQNKAGKAKQEPRSKQRQTAGKMARGGEEKMWIH